MAGQHTRYEWLNDDDDDHIGVGVVIKSILWEIFKFTTMMFAWALIFYHLFRGV
jgi:hypothetical protein